jgi:hypothetical protein
MCSCLVTRPGVNGEPVSAQADRSQPVAATPPEQQILVRIEQGGLAICEAQLRYQLDTKDQHPLASAAELLDLLAELEDRGLIESALHFRLTARGRGALPEDFEARKRAGSVDGIPWSLT